MWGIGLFIFENDKWNRLYNNCSRIDATPLPWEKRRFVPESMLLIALSTIYYSLYLPCMYSFWRNMRNENGRPNACYQLMFYIGIVDMGSLWIAGFVHSFSFLFGLVYCAHPQMYFLLWLMAMTFTDAEAFADTILALNRCIEILSPYWAERMFGGKRIWFWLGAASIYGIKALLLYRPLIYNGVIFLETINPYFGFWDDGGLVFPIVPLITVQELLLCFGTPTIYGFFLIALWVRMKGSTGGGDAHKITKFQWMAFIQVFLISLFNVIAGAIYFTMEHYPAFITSQTLVLGHFAWVNINGIPPVICILFNKTVRADIRLLYTKLFQSNRVHHVDGVIMISPSTKFVVPQAIYPNVRSGNNPL